MNKKPMHRVAAGTKAARQLQSYNGKIMSNTTHRDQEIEDWNAEVERKKELKKRRKP